jgi:hypothetical protein
MSRFVASHIPRVKTEVIIIIIITIYWQYIHRVALHLPKYTNTIKLYKFYTNYIYDTTAI